MELDLLHPLIKGGDSKRFHLSRTNRLILFPYASQGKDNTTLIPKQIFQANYPLTWTYLLDNKSPLENRERGKMKGIGWYGYVYPKALDIMSLPKVFTPDIAIEASFSLDETGEVFFTGGVAGGYGILVKPKHSREYILGLLNSKLLDWFIHQTATQMRGGYFSYESRFIRHLPVHMIDLTNANDRRSHDQIINYVVQILAIKQANPAADTSTLESEIDQIVYQLYGLTDEEIAIVEEAVDK